MEWKTPAWSVLIPYILLALVLLAVGVYLWLVPSADPIYKPGPTSVQKVYETKWKDRVKPVPYYLPTNAKVEFFPKEGLMKASKIPDVPDNVVAFGKVPKHSGDTTIFGTLRPGQDNVFRGGLEFRQEATPFWGFEREFHGGVYYGIAGENIVEGQIRAKFLRTGPLTWQGQGRIGMEKDGGRLNGAILVGVEF